MKQLIKIQVNRETESFFSLGGTGTKAVHWARALSLGYVQTPSATDSVGKGAL